MHFPITRALSGLLSVVFISNPVWAVEISGAGSSAAKPLYTKWAQTYNVKLNYQANGSAEGIKMIKARAVDFGASDIAPPPDEIKKDQLVVVPTAVSGVVPVLNLPKLKPGELQMSGEVLADIFAHKITQWNDPAIAALNPNLTLPKLPIITVARQDGSGTTYNFSDYLSTISSSWKSQYGKNFSIKWPAETQLAKGSADLAAMVKQTAGAIGYIDFKFVNQEKLNYVHLKNRDGKFVAPTNKGFESALNNSGWRNGGNFEEMLNNRPGVQTWPITAGTFIVLPLKSKNPARTIDMLKFFTQAMIKGDGIADSADFVPLPDAVQARVFRELLKISDESGKPLAWSAL